jgi:heme A synthase
VAVERNGNAGETELMEDFHRYLGEGLFIIYLIVMIVALIMGRRNETVPPWLTGAAHALLGLQVAVGLILLADGGLRGEPWYHPVLGLITLFALALMPVFRSRMRSTMAPVALFGLIAVLALITQFTARF